MVKKISVLFFCFFLSVLFLFPYGERTAVVTMVKGDFAQVDIEGKGNLVDCKKGMVLTEKSVIVTGIESEVGIEYGKNGKMKIAEMSQVKLAKIFYEADKIKCKVDLKVGEVDVKVDPNLVEVDFSVSTPTSTASVRGTHERVGYYPGFGTRVHVLQGKVYHISKKGESFHLAKGDTSSASEATEQMSTPYQESITDYKQDYIDEGRTEDEVEAVADVVAPVADTPVETETVQNVEDVVEEAVDTVNTYSSLGIRGILEGNYNVDGGTGSLTIGW